MDSRGRGNDDGRNARPTGDCFGIWPRNDSLPHSCPSVSRTQTAIALLLSEMVPTARTQLLATAVNSDQFHFRTRDKFTYGE